MSAFRLPNAMPETSTGRLPEGKRAYENGITTNKRRRTMAKNGLNRKRTHRWQAALVLLSALGALSACSGESRSDLSADAAGGAAKEEIYGGGVRGLNYSSDAIYSFSVTGPRGMNGGGANMGPAYKEGPGEAGEKCCIGIPKVWKPNTQLKIEWERDRKPFDYKDRSGLAVLTAIVTVPEYAARTSGFWAIFLPGDRVKVMVADGNANGHNDLNVRPADDDPFIVKGVRDEALTQQALERFQ
ncbi:DUF3304 domain-containing protein [Cupriavidus sp. BIC8F]|uniref:DUF3304 domain-containing protein n=1 Tax=Cupriavidus sp. BIC8F TaxID=3079014 RepID=UPI0029167E04|nr:DUF3304 domain-containing protein [Cupriavidus sp. BIC8F]